MPVQAITGLPGSGKSCYAMRLMYNLFLDWARYEKKHKKPFERKLYTNIPLKIEAINKTASKDLGFDVDLSYSIVPLEEDFFVTENGEARAWWEDFELGSFVIVDEVQNLLPAQQNSDKQAKELRKSFMQYVSMHRHKQQDLIFMSQSITNVSTDIRKMIAVIYDVINVKDLKFGPFWPFQIPMADLDVVKEAWGMSTQFAHVKRGRQEGNKFVYDKNCEMFLMTPFLFDMYKSHTKSGDEVQSDRPSLKLGKIGSLLWLARRHGFRLGIATSVIYVALSTGMSTLKAMPTIVMEAVKGTAPEFSDKNAVSTPNRDAFSVTSISPPLVAAPLSEAKMPAEDIITGMLKGAVITPRGVLHVGDEFVYENEIEVISAVDFTKGILVFENGKTVHK